jgi:hypothetical protein
MTHLFYIDVCLEFTHKRDQKFCVVLILEVCVQVPEVHGFLKKETMVQVKVV